MTRDELLYKICPIDITFDCCSPGNKSCNCDDCERVMNKWLDEYDKHIIEQYKENTKLKDTIRDIHDNVANEMYCKAIEEYKNALLKLIKDEQDTRYGYLNERDIREVAKQLICIYESEVK